MRAILKEFTYYAVPLVSKSKDGVKRWNDKLLCRFPRLSHMPLNGCMWLTACNLSLLIEMLFWQLDSDQYEMVATRAGWMTVAQLPLVFLMSGKTSIAGRLTGTFYEPLNWIHRTVSRCMFITALIHIGYFFRSWARHDYIASQLKFDLHSRRGLGAWCVLFLDCAVQLVARSRLEI